MNNLAVLRARAEEMLNAARLALAPDNLAWLGEIDCMIELALIDEMMQ